MLRYFLIVGLGLPALLGAEASDELFGDQGVTIYGHRAGASTQTLEEDAIDAIRSSGGLKEALDTAAGLDVQGLSGSKSFGKLSIRGADPKHTLVLLNGQKLSQDFDLGSIPTEDLEHVEILKGPEALAYSPEALGGVLLITTRQPDGVREHWALGGSLGAFSTSQVQLSSPDLRAGRYTGSFNANGSRTAGYTENTDEEALTLEQSSSLVLGGDHVALKAGYLQRKGGIPLAKSIAANGSGEVDEDDREDRQAVNITLSDDRPWGGGSFAPALDYSYVSVRRLNPFDEDAQAGVPRDNTDKGLHGALRLPWTLHSGEAKFDIDAEAAEESLESGQAGWHARSQAALALRTKFKLGAPFSLELCGRADQVEGFPVDLEPVASATWEFSPGGRLALSAGGGRKIPELDQLYRSGQAFGPLAPPEFGAGEKGNPGLQPERSLKTQAVLDWRGSALNVNVAGYADFLSDLIELQMDPADNYWTYANLGQARVYGAEAALSARLGRLSPFTNATYVDSRELNGQLIPGRLRQKLCYGAAWEPVERLALKVDHQYFERTGSTSPYWMLNAGVTAKTQGGQKVFVNACNLLDQRAEALPGLPLRGRYVEAGTRIEF
jgi:outer membrane receptor protein involved in Fe transport